MNIPKTIADLPPGVPLTGTRFVYPGDGQKYYWHSQWQKGVWGKKDKQSEQVFPLFCEDLKDALKWRLAK
jgi:hypothetical protein